MATTEELANTVIAQAGDHDLLTGLSDEKLALLRTVLSQILRSDPPTEEDTRTVRDLTEGLTDAQRGNVVGILMVTAETVADLLEARRASLAQDIVHAMTLFTMNGGSDKVH